MTNRFGQMVKKDKHRGWTVVASLVLALLFIAVEAPAQAAVITVNTTDDELNSDGDCSLREAIQAANTDTAVDSCTAGNGADTIRIPAGTYTLAIPGKFENLNATGDFDITSDVVIKGAGARSTIIDGAGLDRVFHTHFETVVEIAAVTVQGGYAVRGGGSITNRGGGILAERPLAFTLRDATLRDNIADGFGAGIHIYRTNDVGGSGAVFNSTVTNNTSPVYAGISADASTVTVSNTTVSGNHATRKFNFGGQGGGIGSNNAGVWNISYTTISGNTATYSDSAMHFQGGGGTNVTFNGVIITDHLPSTGPGGGICYMDLGSATFGGGDYNVYPEGDCAAMLELHGGIGSVVTSVSQVDPLANNGGQTDTHALLATSDALDLIPPSLIGCGTFVTEDQRQLGSRPIGSGCDAGAYEYEEGVGGPTNSAPVANAGPPQTVEATGAAGAAVTLDGSGSSDPDGDPLTLTWTGGFPEGSGTVTGVAPTVTLGLGTHTIHLMVDDGISAPAMADVSITVVAPLVVDSDGDGVVDDDDAFPDSDLSPTVVIGGCDTGVANDVLANGASFNDLIGQAAADARNHGKFVSAVKRLSNGWKKAGLISGKEHGKIVSCAARADLP